MKTNSKKNLVENIVVDKQSAEIGDIVVYDKVKCERRFVKLKTFNIETIDSNFIVVGVVYYRTKTKVHVVSGRKYLEQWAAPYEVRLDGFNISAGGSFTVTVNLTKTDAIIYSSSDNLNVIANKIMSALEEIGCRRSNSWRSGWSVEALNGHIVVKQNWFSPNVSAFAVSDKSGKIKCHILTGNYQTALSGLKEKQTGYSSTKHLASKLFLNADGISSPAYPAAHKASCHGIIVDGHITGFEPGNWWLPSSHEMSRVANSAAFKNGYIVNVALSAIRGEKISQSDFYWCSSEYSSRIAWVYNGNGGHMAANTKYHSGSVRPVTAF